jgi:hypothetical protein
MRLLYLAAFAILLLLFAVWSLSTTSSFNACTAKQTAAQSEQANENAPRSALSVIDIAAIRVRCAVHVIFEYRDALTAIATVFIALFTLTLWWSTREMMSATKASVDLARREFIASHRPLVVVRFIQGPFYDDDGREYAYLTVANVGETAATITSIGHDLARRKENGEWVPPGLAADLRTIDPVALESGDRHVITVSAQLPISETMIFGETTGIYELCIVGRLRYQDANGRARETGFLRAYDETRKRFVVLPADAEDNYQD